MGDRAGSASLFRREFVLLSSVGRACRPAIPMAAVRRAHESEPTRVRFTLADLERAFLRR
jgi:hypothetical protein